MRIFIDADGCPVVNQTIQIAKKYNIDVTIISDTSHEFKSDYAEVIIVDKGADSVDFKLANLIKNGDIAVTQDYGLAAMILAKRGIPIRQDGLIYNDFNIDSLLNSRHTAQKIRRAGGRLRGNSKRTALEDESFIQALNSVISKGISN